MKKVHAVIFALLLSLGALSYAAAETSAQAALCCNDLSNCCNDECCGGPGTVNGCALSCQGGTSITCPQRNTKGTCGSFDLD